MSKSKILTVALIVCLAVLAGCAWFMFGTTGAGISYANADKYTVGGTTVTDTVENLFIDWTEGKVNIEYHAGSGITVSETADRDLSEDDQLRWWLDGTTLRIRYAKPGFRISVSLHKQLTVSLPEGTVLKTAEIGSTSGDLNIPALAADEIRLDSTSGNVFAVTDTKKLTASATSGDMDIRQDSDIGTVVLGSTSGSIACTLGNVSDVTAHSTSGSVRLAVTGSAGTVKLDSTSGSIYPDLASADKAEFSSTSGSVEGKAAAFRDMKIGSTSGTVAMKLPALPGFTCEIGTASGDFSTDLFLTKNGNTYTCGDGSARLSINTTSGNIRLEQIR